MMVKLLCFVLIGLILGVHSQTGQNIRVAMQKAQVVGTPTKGIGVGLNSGIVSSLRSNKRVAPYDMFTLKFQTTPTTNEIDDFSFASGLNATYAAVNYVQGTIMYALLGVIMFLLTVIWVFVYIGVCCYGCCVNCCCKIKRKEDDETNYALRINICRVVLLSYVIFTILLLLPWTILTWQVNQDASNTINHGVSQSNVIQNYIYNGLTVVNNITDFANVVQNGINDIAPTVMSILPVDNITMCFNTIIGNLPNATVMLNFIKQAEKAINALPDLNVIQSNMLTIPNNISIVQQTTFFPLNDTFFIIQRATADIALKMGVLLAQLTVVNQGYTVNITKNTETAQKMMNELTTTLTDANLASLISRMYDINHADTTSTATMLSSFASSVDRLNQMDLSGLSVDLGLLALLKTQVNATLLKSLVDDIIADNATVNWGLAQTRLHAYNQSLGNVYGGINSMFDQLQNMSNAVGMFPSSTILTTELAKLTTFVSNMDCINGILDSIRVINQTIIQLSPSISSSINQFGNVQQQVSNMNVTQIPTSQLTDIGNKTVSIQPQINEMTGNFSDALSKLNTKSTETQANYAYSNYTALFSYWKPNSMKSDMNGFATQQSNLVDFTDQTTWVAGINTASSAIDTDDCRNKVTQLQGASASPCSASECVQSQYTPLGDKITALQAAISELPGRGQSPSIITQLGTEKTVILAMPNMTNDYIVTYNSMQVNAVTAPGVVQQVAITMIYLVVQNISLNILQSLPYGDVIPVLQPLQQQIAAARSLFANAENEIGQYQSKLNTISSNNPANLLGSITSSIGSIPNITSMISSITGSITPTITSVNSTLNMIFGYRDTYMSYVYEYDGIRLLVLAIIILIPIFLPFFGTCAICCPKFPCTLLLFAFIAVVVTFISWILVAVLLPINVLLEDTCANIENYATKAAITLGGSSLNNTISFQTSVMGLNISLNVNPLEIIPAYLSPTGCSGTDPITQVINSVTSQLNGVNNVVGNLVAQQLKQQSFVLLPGGYALISKLTGPIIGNASSVINSFGTYIGCNSINGLYRSTKDVVCGDVSNVIAATDLGFLLLGLLFWFGAVFGSFSYCFLTANKVIKAKEESLDEELGVVFVPHDGGEEMVQIDESKLQHARESQSHYSRQYVVQDSDQFFAPLENDRYSCASPDMYPPVPQPEDDPHLYVAKQIELNALKTEDLDSSDDDNGGHYPVYPTIPTEETQHVTDHIDF
jgi:hypothetical protein